MKLLVLSDLHLELGHSYTVPRGLEYDVVVLAGDISCPGSAALHWARRESTFGGRPVVFVPGNHEFYGYEMTTELAAMRGVVADGTVHLLNRGTVVIDGVRFLGCTLWTDFQLPIQEPVGTSVNIERALGEANRHMNDFRLIKLEAPSIRGPQPPAARRRRLLRAEDTLAMHWIDRDWLRRQLEQRFDGRTVVVSHHAPARGSVAPRYAGDWLTPAFVSDLPGSFFEVPKLWVHGHTHSPFDYRSGSCRVASNPRGYRMRDSSWENHLFDPGCVIEL